MDINPEIYKLPSRVKLRTIDKNHLAVVRFVKSRIIQKDAKKILELAKQIQSIDSDLQISLICTSNICAKSIELLKLGGISVIIE